MDELEQKLNDLGTAAYEYWLEHLRKPGGLPLAWRNLTKSQRGEWIALAQRVIDGWGANGQE
jgi:hypothetical protein